MAEAGKTTRVEIDLERLASALGEYSSILERVSEDLGDLKAEIDSYLSGAGKSDSSQAQGKQSYKGKPKGRSKYVFNRAILAVLHKHGCMSQGEVMSALKLGKDEAPAFQDAWEYLTSKGVVVPDSAKRCWTVRG